METAIDVLFAIFALAIPLIGTAWIVRVIQKTKFPDEIRKQDDHHRR